MNDMEANLRQFFDVRRGSVELSSTEAPQKLNSCLLKLRQLVKKNSIHASPNQTFQQNPDNHMSKQTMEGTLWETCSPTASYLNDSVHLVVKKPRNTTSNKLNMTVTSKANSQNSFALYQPNIEDMKGRTPSTRPSSTKVNGLMSSMSSPKATYLDLNVTDHLNGSRSTKSGAFNPHKFINFLLSQPKTSTNQGKKAAKVNSCMQGEEENDDNNTKNISGETRGTTKSFATFKKSVADVKSTMQQEGQENKVPVIQEYNLEKLRVSKSKVKIGLQLSEVKKNERSLTLTKKSSSGNLRKKKDLHENDSLNEVEKNRRDTIDKSKSKKRLAVTPDTLTHRERENEPEVQIDNKALRLTPKLFKACNDLLASRKDSAQKDARLKSRKRSSTRSKGQRLKSASKRNLKQESPVKNAVVERAGNSRRQNAPGSLMLRAVKGSTPNILSSSISRIGGLSTKILKKGESHTYLSNITGEFEKSNEMTMSHAHDTTANTKMGSRKDLTIDENNRDSVLLKRLLRAKSQGGKAIEEALAEMANNRDKETQLGARSNGRVLSLKNSMKDKRTLAAFKSVDEKSSIFKDSADVNKSTCNKTLNLEQKFESVMDHNSQEKSKESDQMGLLCKVLQRTKQMLGDYQEREKVWQSEKQDLLKQIINLQKSK